MVKQSLYVETTIIGWLTNRPSTDIVLEAHRQLTHKWWDQRRSLYQLVISQVVLDEISKGDRAAAQDRLAIVDGIPLLAIDQTIAASAAQLVKIHALPPKALQDAFHIAIAAHHQVDFLLTWNCAHIANPHILKLVRQYFAAMNLVMPEITTPEGMLGGEDARSHP